MARILIVDDERENLESLTRALGDENPDWEILGARNEPDALAMIENQLAKKEPVDVILTDLVMESDGSGMNVLRRARQLDPNVMSILFTAKEKSLDRYMAFDYGAFDVVEKNIPGVRASHEINIKTRAALQFREYSQRITFLQRYFDPKVFSTIERDPALLAISARTVTIAFWDIRGFSKLCESLKAEPTLISGFLREYLELGAKTVFKHGGVLDKFIGDGIMALFGVLNHKTDSGKHDANAAVNAALELRSAFAPLLAKWLEEWKLYVPDKIEVGLGCGIHTGEVLVGNVGTDFRDQFTALGPHVNFASRIEGRALINQILLSQSTEARVREHFSCAQAGEISDVKNIPGTFPLYTVTKKRAKT